MKDKKGQAAMEFLMTYGWAILAAVIAIGVLAYFGVFSPGKYISGTAIVSAPFYIQAHNVKAASINLGIKNNGGEPYTLTNVSVEVVGKPACYNQTGLNALVDTTLDTNIPCVTGSVGDNFKADITISYTKAGSTIPLTSTGTIAEKITA